MLASAHRHQEFWCGCGTARGGAGLPDVDLHAVRADDLRYLVVVANTGRLVAAATALGVDHTTVSRRIKALEKVLRSA